jgi:hypothetical protein
MGKSPSDKPAEGAPGSNHRQQLKGLLCGQAGGMEILIRRVEGKQAFSEVNWHLRASPPIGIMECWNMGKMGFGIRQDGVSAEIGLDDIA